MQYRILTCGRFAAELRASRLTHRVPLLWRFHSVHHSIEQMDWVASGRLHPLDSAFTQACTIAPLIILGYHAGVFAGVLTPFMFRVHCDLSTSGHGAGTCSGTVEFYQYLTLKEKVVEITRTLYVRRRA